MKTIQLNTVKTTSPNYKKYSALVDDEDFEKVNQYNWSAMISERARNIYAYTQINGQTVLLHKFITGYKITDHINRNGLDCQRSNLREATKSQNAMNARSRLNSKSEYKGVYFSKSLGKWYSQIFCEGKKICIGVFKREVNAAQAYNFMAEKLHGKFANFNRGLITVLIGIALVFLASGCDNVTGVSEVQADVKQSSIIDNFLLTQSYGYCNDTMCVGTSIILDIIEGQNEQCVFLYINTGDTVYNGLSFDKFSIDYNLSHSYTVDFGNGNKQIFNNEGTYIIDWKCNKTYEVIICYE